MSNLLRIALRICHIFIFSFPLRVSGATAPSDVTVQQGATATLTCSLGSPLGSFALWLDEDGAFADVNDILPGASAKYDNFALVKDDIANGQYDLRIDNAQYEDEGEYRCQFGASPLPAATLTVQVPATSLTIAVDDVDQSSTATLTENVAVRLTCTALGAKPRVSIDWFKGSEPLTPDTEMMPPGGEPTDTLSTYDPFIPTRSDDGVRIECRTSGHQTTQSEFITLNVLFAPVVTSLRYSEGTITCEADANPITDIEYYIILNGTRPSAPTGPTLAFNVDENYCTDVSCEVTNAVGTGSKELEEPLCPGYVEPTTQAPSNPSGTTPKPSASGLSTAASIGIGCGCAVAALLVIGAIIYCYMTKKFCFDSNKTSNGGSSPKKQPSVNADMIRNQPEVRQSVHKYDDEPKKPRVARGSSGKSAPAKETKQKVHVPPRDNDRQGHPMDSFDGDQQQGGGPPGVGVAYADLEFKNREQATNGHNNVHPPSEEPTQYASILV